MNKEELKNKYSTFITEISEILGLGKPIDILKLCATTDLFFQPLEKRIEELEAENAEQKCECRRCVYTDCPCVLSDYGKDKNGVCDHFKDVFDENAELKKELVEKGQHLDLTEREWGKDLDKQIHFKTLCTKLEKENTELKEQNRSLLESCEGATMMYKDLCKAKEIIKKYLAIGVGGKITQNYLDVTKEAELFLNSKVKNGN